MSKSATIHSRIDPDLKHNAEEILHNLGLTASQAISAFYAQIIHVKGLPFEVKIPNEETLEAMRELGSKNVKTYQSMDEIWDEIDNEE